MSSTATSPGKGGAGGRGRKGSKPSQADKAGLVFPVGRIRRYLKEGKYADRCATAAPVYLAAVLEYLASEVLDIAGMEAKKGHQHRIKPMHIQMAMQQDDELDKLCEKVMIPGAGVLANRDQAFLSKYSAGKKNGASTSG